VPTAAQPGAHEPLPRRRLTRPKGSPAGAATATPSGGRRLLLRFRSARSKSSPAGAATPAPSSGRHALPPRRLTRPKHSLAGVPTAAPPGGRHAPQRRTHRPRPILSPAGAPIEVQPDGRRPPPRAAGTGRGARFRTPGNTEDKGGCAEGTAVKANGALPRARGDKGAGGAAAAAAQRAARARHSPVARLRVRGPWEPEQPGIVTSKRAGRFRFEAAHVGRVQAMAGGEAGPGGRAWRAPLRGTARAALPRGACYGARGRGRGGRAAVFAARRGAAQGRRALPCVAGRCRRTTKWPRGPRLVACCWVLGARCLLVAACCCLGPRAAGGGEKPGRWCTRGAPPPRAAWGALCQHAGVAAGGGGAIAGCGGVLVTASWGQWAVWWGLEGRRCGIKGASKCCESHSGWGELGTRAGFCMSVLGCGVSGMFHQSWGPQGRNGQESQAMAAASGCRVRPRLPGAGHGGVARACARAMAGHGAHAHALHAPTPSGGTPGGSRPPCRPPSWCGPPPWCRLPR
jgi:hypothetical protein